MKRWSGTGRCRWMIAPLDRSQKRFRLYGAVQLCAVRLYGRFLGDVRELSPRITNYLNHQLELPPSLASISTVLERTNIF